MNVNYYFGSKVRRTKKAKVKEYHVKLHRQAKKTNVSTFGLLEFVVLLCTKIPCHICLSGAGNICGIVLLQLVKDIVWLIL